MATIKDIARAAGVAQGTVSNVLNNTGKVSTDKIRRVEEAIARLGYVPNVQASMLRQGTPKTVAIIVPTLEESCYLHFYLSVCSAIQDAGYEARVYTTSDADSIEFTVLERIRISSIVAVLTVSTLSDRCCEQYQSFPCSVVYIERKPQELRPQDSFYGFDTLAIAQQWVEKLLSSDYKRVALFLSDKHFLNNPETTQILNEAADANGIELVRFFSNANLALSTAFDIVQAEHAFDAIVCFCSTYTSSIETAFNISQIIHRPMLHAIESTSVHLPEKTGHYVLDYTRLGVTAGNAILSRVNGEEDSVSEVILPPKGFPYCFPQTYKRSPTTISMFTLDNPSTNALRKLLPMFEVVSGVKVELTCVSYEELHAKLKNLTQESIYDIIRIDMADFPEIGSSLYSPLSPILPLDSKLKQLQEGIYERYSLINGEPYALPFDPSVMLFLYRQDLFSNQLLQRAYYEEYREKLEVPTTIEQYVRVAQFFTRSVFEKSPTEFGSTTTCGSDATFASDFLPFYLGSGGHVATNAKLNPLNSPEMVAAMTKYKKMQSFTCKQQWWRDSLQQFASGNSAMTVAYSNYVSDVVNAQQSNIIGQIGAAVLPGGHPLLGGGVIGVSRFSQKQDACRQFLAWFYSDDVASLMVRLGGTSPLDSAYSDSSTVFPRPWLASKKESIACGTRGADDASIPGFSIRRYEFAIGTAIQKLVLEDIPPEHAAVIAQTLYDYSTQGTSI